MTIIAAKPTLYRGTRFRSRLEARWAVFLDSIGLEWTYEPKVSGGYMPDFQLGDLAFVEIKPASWHPKPDDDWSDRAKSDFARYEIFVSNGDRVLFVFFGEPGTWENGVRTGGSRGFRVEKNSVAKVRWEECARCGALPLVSPDERVCRCPQEYGQLERAFNAVRDASYEDAP